MRAFLIEHVKSLISGGKDSCEVAANQFSCLLQKDFMAMDHLL